ncbi:hypothetical protein ACPXBS_26110, partial [Escherichia coli]|uniref:hypothetical protein n=1 Tax=Escherichia coli TaxID=562 RepID=UPI003CE55792
AAIAIGTLAIAGCGGAAREAAPSSPPTGGAAAPTSEADKREEPRVSRPADAVPASAPEAHPTVRTTGAKADGGHVDPMVEFSNASAT